MWSCSQCTQNFQHDVQWRLMENFWCLWMISITCLGLSLYTQAPWEVTVQPLELSGQSEYLNMHWQLQLQLQHPSEQLQQNLIMNCYGRTITMITSKSRSPLGPIWYLALPLAPAKQMGWGPCVEALLAAILTQIIAWCHHSLALGVERMSGAGPCRWQNENAGLSL